jgi:magnesium-transporting ATPase (P-type)
MQKFRLTEFYAQEQINNHDGRQRKSKRYASGIQQNAAKVSKAVFLLSIALAVPAILFGILGHRDIIAVILTCLTASAAAFSEQFTIIVDFALTSGMSKSAGFGAVIKKTADIDKLNKIDMLIAKKREICEHENLRLEKIYFTDRDFEIAYENRHDIRYALLSAAAVCGLENTAVTKAVFNAADSLKVDYKESQKLGAALYNPSTGIRSATILDKGVTLACFGEAEHIVERCANQITGRGKFEPANIPDLENKLLGLYEKYDLVMAVALKKSGNVSGSLNIAISDLDFYAFLVFSENKSSSVRKDITSLKNLGITPVMIADSSGVYTYKTAVNFGIISEHELERHIFYIHAGFVFQDLVFDILVAEREIALVQKLRFFNIACRYRRVFPA